MIGNDLCTTTSTDAFRGEIVRLASNDLRARSKHVRIDQAYDSCREARAYRINRRGHFVEARALTCGPYAGFGVNSRRLPGRVCWSHYPSLLHASECAQIGRKAANLASVQGVQPGNSESEGARIPRAPPTP